MKRHSIFSLLLIGLLLAGFVSSACNVGRVLPFLATSTPTSTNTPTPTKTPLPTNTPTVTLIPETELSLNVTRASVQSTFEQMGFTFSDLPDTDGQPTVQGTFTGGKYLITLIGQENDISKAILQVSTDEPEPAAAMVVLFFIAVIPDQASEAIQWFTDTLSEGSVESHEVVIGDRSIMEEVVFGSFGSAIKITIQSED